MRAADAHPSRRADWHDHGRATPVYFRGRQNGWILASGEADSRPCGDGGNQDVFVLHPKIAVTRKPLMSVERRLLEYGSKIDGRLYVYGFQTLYPHLSSDLSDGAQTQGYRFLDLTGVFDRMSVQTFTDYCHHTPAGDQAVTDAIFDSLAASIPVRAGNKDNDRPHSRFFRGCQPVHWTPVADGFVLHR